MVGGAHPTRNETSRREGRDEWSLPRRLAQEFVEVRGDRLGEGQGPDGRLPLLAGLPVERVEDFVDGPGRAEELIEVRRHRFLERQEPDRGFPLLAVLPVERLEDLSGGP